MPQTITIDGVTLTLEVERKRVKNVNARLRGTTLSVSAPLTMAQTKLNEIIPDLARRLLRRAHARQINADDDALALAKTIAQRFPQKLTVDQVQFVTTQEMRWGSYSPATRTIRLNAVLRQMPRWVLESVVAHELAHIVHPNHAPAFWELLRRVDPDTDRAEAFLAGIAWLSRHWDTLPPVERALLTRVPPGVDGSTEESEEMDEM